MFATKLNNKSKVKIIINDSIIKVPEKLLWKWDLK